MGVVADTVEDNIVDVSFDSCMQNAKLMSEHLIFFSFYDHKIDNV